MKQCYWCLVITKSCMVTAVRDLLEKFTEACLFFQDSPKPTTLLKKIVPACIQDPNRRKGFLDLCKTRRSVRQEAYSHCYASFSFIMKALEVTT